MEGRSYFFVLFYSYIYYFYLKIEGMLVMLGINYFDWVLYSYNDFDSYRWLLWFSIFWKFIKNLFEKGKY